MDVLTDRQWFGLAVALYLASTIYSVFLWRNGRCRPCCVFFWAVTAVAAAQMFVYLPNQRFKTVIFDLPALLMVIVGAVRFAETRGWVREIPREW